LLLPPPLLLLLLPLLDRQVGVIPASPSRSQVLSVAQTSHIVDLQVGQTSSARADRGHEINIIIYFISVLVTAMKIRRGVNWHFKKQKGDILIH